MNSKFKFNHQNWYQLFSLYFSIISSPIWHSFDATSCNNTSSFSWSVFTLKSSLEVRQTCSSSGVDRRDFLVMGSSWKWHFRFFSSLTPSSEVVLEEQTLGAKIATNTRGHGRTNSTNGSIHLTNFPRIHWTSSMLDLPVEKENKA